MCASVCVAMCQGSLHQKPEWACSLWSHVPGSQQLERSEIQTMLLGRLSIWVSSWGDPDKCIHVFPTNRHLSARGENRLRPLMLFFICKSAVFSVYDLCGLLHVCGPYRHICVCLLGIHAQHWYWLGLGTWGCSMLPNSAIPNTEDHSKIILLWFYEFWKNLKGNWMSEVNIKESDRDGS